MLSPNFLQLIPETTTGGVIAIVIVFLILWFQTNSDKKTREVLTQVAACIKASADKMSASIDNNTKSMNKQNLVAARNTEVLRNLTGDIKDIKDHIHPITTQTLKKRRTL